MLVKSQVKYIQSLSQKKLRDEDGVFVAEGPKIINELLNATNIKVLELFAVKEWINEQPAGIAGAVTAVTEAELERLSLLQTPHLVTGIFKKPQFPPVIQVRNKISLMLDTIQDPGNMGSIMRCADWFGIDLLVCSNGCADVFNPKVVQATMGSISRVQVLYTDPEQFLQQHDEVPVYAATLNGTSLKNITPPGEGIILIGNESQGIHESLLEKCDHRITIPRKGKAESLNAAVATGIILSHMCS